MNIQIGDIVRMPEPNDSDIYHHGGFNATVINILENGNLIVTDQDSDHYEIEHERVVKL